jgi:hypothetical protein
VSFKGLRTTFFFVAACAAAFGSTVVVPGTQTNTPGNLPIHVGGAPSRLQEIIGSGNFGAFSGPLVITGIRFRAAVGTGPVSFQYASTKITLSTTKAYPNTLNGHTLPSSTYASNVGPDAATVYNAALSGSSPGCSGAGPCPFDMVIPFATPFSYDPSKGRLLVDMVSSAPTGAPIGKLDGVGYPDSNSSSIAIVNGDPTQPNGTLFLGGIVFGVDTPTPAATYAIAHFPYGAGWSSRVLIGAGSGGATVDVSFFSQSGAAATVPLQGQGNQSTQHLTLGPNEVGVVAADPTQRNVDINNVTVDWARATSSGPVNIFTLFDYGPAHAPTSVPVTRILGSVGAQSMPPAKSFHFPASFYGPLGYNAGLAIANPNAASTAYSVTLLNADGSTKHSVQRPALPPNGQSIFVLTDIMPGVITPDSVNPFDGSVVVCASQPVGLVAIGVEGGALFTTSVTNDFPCP